MKISTSRIERAAAALVTIGFFALAGCGGHSPKTAATDYINNLKIFNYNACYQAMAHQTQIDRTLDQFLEEIPLAPVVSRDWFKSVLHVTDFALGDEKVDGDKATVAVKVTAPDLALWERTIDAQLGPNDTPDSIAQKQINENGYPKMTYDDNVVMVKQGDDWKISVDYPFLESVMKEHKEAVDDYHKHDYDKAVAAYQKILDELDKTPTTGSAGLRYQYARELENIQTAQKQIPDAQAYIPKITLSDVDLKMAASRVPGIFGKMTNAGDKAIDEVQFTVNYNVGKGKKQTTVYSESHTPIATPLEFTNFARPVLPFVPGETRSFGFKLTAPTDVQQKATPDINVTSIVFTQSSAPLPKPAAPPSPAASGSAAASPAAAAASPAAAASSAPAAKN